MSTSSIIPKKIHYCWFGRNKKSKLIRKCIASWKKQCPDYEIIEWNEDNFDINICEYVKEAYKQKKWAFVSDYVRFYALKKYGGIYMDTDVQLLKPIDELLGTKFVGFAHDDVVATGLIMATTKDDWLCRRIVEEMNNEQFEWQDPLQMFSIGKRTTGIFVEKGLVLNGQLQTVDDYTVYPDYYFNPTKGDMRAKVDERAFSIHHYAASWFPKGARFRNTIKRFLGHGVMNRYKIIKNRLGK